MCLVFNQPGRILRRRSEEPQEELRIRRAWRVSSPRLPEPRGLLRRSVTNKRPCLLSFPAAWTRRHASLGNAQPGEGVGGSWGRGDLSGAWVPPPHTPTGKQTQTSAGTFRV